MIQKITFEVLGKQHIKYSYKELPECFIIGQIQQVAKTAHLVALERIELDSVSETDLNENEFCDISEWFLDIRKRFNHLDEEAVK